MKKTPESRIYVMIVSLVLIACLTSLTGYTELRVVPDWEDITEERAERFNRTADTVLAPAYPPLAKQIVTRYKLEEREGIGIDIGGGPGNLVIELAKQTKKMYWVNADINPHFFPFLWKKAAEAGVSHRIGTIFADAQAMPFKDGYADILVSRGSFPFWDNKLLGFSEVYRVLKPGGVAFIGRGFPESLPVDVARKVRSKQGKGGGGPKYDLEEAAQEIEDIMKELHIPKFRIEMPHPPDSDDVNYGVWVEFHKPTE